MNLRTLLDDNRISQKELAEGISKSEALVSRILSAEVRPNKETIDAILVFLRKKVGKGVTYEKAFGVDQPTPTPVGK